MSSELPPGPSRFRLKRGMHRLKSVRLDRPAGASGEPSPATDRAATDAGASRILDLVRRAIGRQSSPTERRTSRRQPAVDGQIWVGWWEGDEFGVVEGRLIDFSRGGARVVLAVKPPGREPIWLYKESGDAIATVRCQVLRRDVAPDGGFTVRFRFPFECPTFFCQAVLCDQPPRRGNTRARIVPPKGSSRE